MLYYSESLAFLDELKIFSQTRHADKVLLEPSVESRTASWCVVDELICLCLQDIVENLIENSSTFSKKTEFAQQKYIKKKKKK